MVSIVIPNLGHFIPILRVNEEMAKRGYSCHILSFSTIDKKE